MHMMAAILDFPGITSEEIVPLLFAVVLGGIIGFEREWNGKPAGLRTNILICLGATLLTIVGRHLSPETDGVTRVVQGIVTGIGFLGAGAILQGGKGIHGRTTAASIWLVTSIGVACGAGLYGLATVVTGMMLMTLLGLLPITRWVRNRRDRLNLRPGHGGNSRNPSDFSQ
jgi:putative Mg2+ transporter-C (MgtC) family protein